MKFVQLPGLNLPYLVIFIVNTEQAGLARPCQAQREKRQGSGVVWRRGSLSTPRKLSFYVDDSSGPNNQICGAVVLPEIMIPAWKPQV